MPTISQDLNFLAVVHFLLPLKLLSTLLPYRETQQHAKFEAFGQLRIWYEITVNCCPLSHNKDSGITLNERNSSLLKLKKGWIVRIVGSLLITKPMKSPQLSQLINFLKQDLAIPEDALDMALRKESSLTQLPMILWQYGLVSLKQLDKIFDWLEAGAYEATGVR